MKFIALLVLLFTGAPASDSDAHPIQSVIKLLKELQDQVWDEGQEQEATWRKFQKWCVDNALDDNSLLVKAVQSDKDDIDSLTDTVASKTKERDLLEENIEHLTDEIAKYDAEETQAKKDRDDARKVYEAADKDFETTLKAIDEAIKALTDSKKASMLQFLKPENQRQEKALRDLIQQPLVLEQLTDEQRDSLSAAVFGGKPVTEADILAKEKYAKAGNTYTFKSGNVIDLLRSLQTHFKDEKTASTKADTAAANEYEVAKDSRKAAIDAAKKAKEDKTKTLGDVKKDLNTAQSDLKDAKDELKMDSESLKDTIQTCKSKEEQFKEHTKLRHHETAALKAAQEILARVGGVQHKTPKNEKAPENEAMMLLQRVQKVLDPKLKQKAVNLLKQEATQEHSKALERFAEQLAVKLDGDSPFAQINNMIQKMIFRLMDEQKDEDEHKRWCDVEVSTSETSEKDKTEKVKMLDAKIKDGKARVDELGDKIADLDKKVAKLTEFMKEASEVRAKNKKDNQAAIKDAEKAQAAIAKAVAVLEQYYKDSGMIEKEAWEFVQTRKAPEAAKLPKQPESWDASYTGVTDPTKAGSGVIAVLKATAADFSKMEADTRSNEIADQEQFDKDMSAADIDKAKSSKESEMKSDEKKRTIDYVASMEKGRKHTQGELEAVKTYLKDLEKPCIKGDSKYEDRKKARADEIEALKKSQVILEQAFDEKAELLQTIHKH